MKIKIFKKIKIEPIIQNGSLTNKNKDKKPLKKVETTKKIEITDGSIKKYLNEVKVFGVYDPEDYNFNLNMWSNTKKLKMLEQVSKG